MTGEKIIDFNGSKVSIKKFDIKKHIENTDYNKTPRILLLARSGSGKSFATRHIINSCHFREGVVFNGSEDVNDDPYSNYIPPIYIYDGYSERGVEKVIKRQKEIAKLNRKRKKQGKTLKNPKIFFVMDDCAGFKDIYSKSQKFIELFKKGRHYSICLLFIAQDPLDLPKDVRDQISHTFIFNQKNQAIIKKIHEHYANISTLKEFKKLLKVMTKDYGVLVYHNNAKSGNLSDQIFWYKAESIKKKIGSSRYRRVGNYMTSKNYRDKGKRIDDVLF